MGASRSAGTWLAVLAGVMVVGLGWAFFALALTTEVFSGDRTDDQGTVLGASPSGDSNPTTSIDGVPLDQHLAPLDERIAALEDAQATAPVVVSSGSERPPISIDGVPLDQHLAPLDERIAALEDAQATAPVVVSSGSERPPISIDGVALDQHLAAVDDRIAALEDAVESVDQASPTQGVPAHDHHSPPVSTFPHVWTRTDSTLPEEFLHVRLAEGWWHFEFEAACIGDLSSCPRPGDRPPALLLRDVADDPFGDPERVESGTEWCEDFEATRDVEWRLWMTNARGVTWSLTIGEGECPQRGE